MLDNIKEGRSYRQVKKGARIEKNGKFTPVARQFY